MKIEKTEAGYTIKEYARLTCKAERTIRQWIKDGKVSCKTVKGKTGVQYLVFPKGLPNDEKEKCKPICKPIGKVQATCKPYIQPDMLGLHEIDNLSPEIVINLIESKAKFQVIEKENEFLKSEIEFLRSQIVDILSVLKDGRFLIRRGCPN